MLPLALLVIGLMGWWLWFAGRVRYLALLALYSILLGLVLLFVGVIVMWNGPEPFLTATGSALVVFGLAIWTGLVVQRVRRQQAGQHAVHPKAR
jgi:hypothetical protein